MRFLLGAAGLLAIAIGLGIVVPQLYGLLSDPYDVDFPGGAPGVLAMILLSGSAPLLGGWFLLRKAFRDGGPAVRPPLVAAGGAHDRVPHDVLADAPPPMDVPPTNEPPPEVPASEVPSSALPDATSVQDATDRSGPAFVRGRRRWLAVLGLSLALFSGLIEMTACAAFIASPPGSNGEWLGMVLFLILFSFPLGLGVWLAHAGDPGIGRRFWTDLIDGITRLRQPAAAFSLLRTSPGLAVAAAALGVPMMLIWRQESAIIGFAFMNVYSVVDPVLNVIRRSWWLGALISIGTWILLLVVLVATADAIAPMREGSLIFMLPMMIFGGALALSGFIRLVMRIAGLPGTDREGM